MKRVIFINCSLMGIVLGIFQTLFPCGTCHYVPIALFIVLDITEYPFTYLTNKYTYHNMKQKYTQTPNFIHNIKVDLLQ